jgi:glutathione S-transferase
MVFRRHEHPTGESRAWFVKWAQRVFTQPREKRLDGREYLACEDFTVADILMTMVLWEIRKTDLMDGFPEVKKVFPAMPGPAGLGAHTRRL